MNEDVRKWLPLVQRIAFNASKVRPHLYDDIHQAAQYGLVKALQSYDSTKGAAIKTHITNHAKWAISHYLRDQADLVRAPRTQAPTGDISSLDVPIPGGESETNLLDIIADDRPAFQSDEVIALREAMETLSARERLIAEMYMDGHSQVQIASKIGVSQMQVSRLLKRLVRRLRKLMTQPDPPLKTCTVCGVTKPHTREFFYRQGEGRLQSHCKPCNDEKNKKNKKKLREKKALERQQQKEPVKMVDALERLKERASRIVMAQPAIQETFKRTNCGTTQEDYIGAVITALVLAMQDAQLDAGEEAAKVFELEKQVAELKEALVKAVEAAAMPQTIFVEKTPLEVEKQISRLEGENSTLWEMTNKLVQMLKN